jgi:hypothetical protein
VTRNDSSNELPRATFIEDETGIRGSAYDTTLSCDTTPASRVYWGTDGDLRGRSAYDTNLMPDTTPTARVNVSPPADNADIDPLAPPSDRERTFFWRGAARRVA